MAIQGCRRLPVTSIGTSSVTLEVAPGRPEAKNDAGDASDASLRILL